MIETQPQAPMAPQPLPLTETTPLPLVALSDAAAAKLRELTAEEANPAIGLRVYVYSGGCCGYRYGMMLEDQPTAEDVTVESHGIKVYVDQQHAVPGRARRSTTSTRSWAPASRSTTPTPCPAAAAAAASGRPSRRAARAPATTEPDHPSTRQRRARAGSPF